MHSDRTGPYPAFGITVRTRRLRRRLHRPYARTGEDSVEHGGELGVTVPDEKPERIDPVTKIHQQVSRLLRRPRAVRVPGHTEDVHPPGRHLHHEQHIQALEEDRVDGEEVTPQQALRLDAEELSP